MKYYWIGIITLFIIFILILFALSPDCISFVTDLVYPNVDYETIKRQYPIVTNNKNYIFYHIGTLGDKWQDVVKEQLDMIRESGLMDRIEMIYYGCNGKECDRLLKDYFKDSDKIKPLENAICPDRITYENTTINAMIEFSRENPDCNILYLHTKGTYNKYTYQTKWRKYMMNYLVGQHELCLDLLNRGFYSVGTLLTICFKYYEGNFWWARSDYIKTLPLIQNMSRRYNAETIILKNRVDKKHINIGKKVIFHYGIQRNGIIHDNTDNSIFIL